MNFWKFARVYRPRQVFHTQKGARLPCEEQKRLEWFTARADAMRRNPTPLEIKLELVLDSLNINHKKQYIVGDFIVDFYLPAYRVVVEADGPHHESAKQRKRDERRDRILIKQFGFRVLHFRAHEFFSVAHMQKRLMELLTGVTAPVQDGLENRLNPANPSATKP